MSKFSYNKTTSRHKQLGNYYRDGFTLIELLVVIAIIAVLAATLVPLVGRALKSGKRTGAINQMKTFGAAATMYTSENDGRLPLDADDSTPSWSAFKNDNTADHWYNGLPEVAGFTSAKDIAESDESSFYNGTSPFYLPGARYTTRSEPHFAFGMNAKLQDGDRAVKVNRINKASKTVLFLERGLRGEESLGADGANFTRPAGAQPSEFVARYNKTGVLGFVDAHAAHYRINNVFESGGTDLRGYVNGVQSTLIWTTDERDDPNSSN